MALNDIEFLRFLIDYIDSKKEPVVQEEPEVETPPTIIINVEQGESDGDDDNFDHDDCNDQPNDPDDVENAMDRDDVFIPPLQAKLEIMKKMAGIQPKNQDLLDQTAIEASEDEPFEG